MALSEAAKKACMQPANPYLIEAGDTTELHLPWPPSVNHYWRSMVIKGSVRLYVSKRGKEYRHSVMCRMKTLRRRFQGSVAVMIEAFPPDRRRRDLDNLLKCVLDSVANAGAMDDDSQVCDLHIIRRPPEKGGRLRVVLTDMRDQLPF